MGKASWSLVRPLVSQTDGFGEESQMPAHSVTVGLTATHTYAVGADDTARASGSGSLEVLATPRLLAWMEAQTCAAVDRALGPEQTSVGTRISLEHLRASGIGATVEVTARVVHVDGRLVRLEAVATQGDTVCGRAEITRVVVDRAGFLERVDG
jgi:fluoroacetyl-CoA thioesterase